MSPQFTRISSTNLHCNSPGARRDNRIYQCMKSCTLEWSGVPFSNSLQFIDTLKAEERVQLCFLLSADVTQPKTTPDVTKNILTRECPGNCFSDTSRRRTDSLGRDLGDWSIMSLTRQMVKYVFYSLQKQADRAESWSCPVLLWSDPSIWAGNTFVQGRGKVAQFIAERSACWRPTSPITKYTSLFFFLSGDRSSMIWTAL